MSLVLLSADELREIDEKPIVFPADFLDEEEIWNLSGEVTVTGADGTAYSYKPKYVGRLDLNADTLYRATHHLLTREELQGVTVSTSLFNDHRIGALFGVSADAVARARKLWGIPSHRLKDVTV